MTSTDDNVAHLPGRLGSGIPVVREHDPDRVVVLTDAQADYVRARYPDLVGFGVEVVVDPENETLLALQRAADEGRGGVVVPPGVEAAFWSGEPSPVAGVDESPTPADLERGRVYPELPVALTAQAPPEALRPPPIDDVGQVNATPVLLDTGPWVVLWHSGRAGMTGQFVRPEAALEHALNIAQAAQQAIETEHAYRAELGLPPLTQELADLSVVETGLLGPDGQPIA